MVFFFPFLSIPSSNLPSEWFSLKAWCFFFEVSHWSQCFHASMMCVSTEGTMMAAFDHTNQNKSNQSELYSVMWSPWPSFRQTTQLVRHMHVSPDEGGYLIPLPHPGHFRSVHCARFKLLVFLCLLPPWPACCFVLCCCFVCVPFRARSPHTFPPFSCGCCVFDLHGVSALHPL